MNRKRCEGLIVGLAGVVAASWGVVPYNGLLLDREMKPKKGVKVYVKDPKRYTTTDKQGRFGLTDVQPDDTLTLVLSKKESVRVPVEGRQGIKIVLVGDNQVRAEKDDEIVNLGYGYVKRREFSGASSGISGDRLRSTGARDVMTALRGMVPGLVITGSPGNYEVTIRGKHSLLLSSEPLYLIDGVVVQSLDFLSVYDVDHVEVIKEASQYGSRGANGAILVTTKTGQSRKKK